MVFTRYPHSVENDYVEMENQRYVDYAKTDLKKFANVIFLSVENNTPIDTFLEFNQRLFCICFLITSLI